MKIYRKIIHPYREVDGKACNIDEYKGRWFSEESEHTIMDEIYDKYAEPNENRIKFFRRFSFRWKERFIEVSFKSDMDNRIEELEENT